MKKAGAATLLVAFVLAIGLASVGQVEAADGKALFESKKCNLCHSIESQGITKKSEKMKGAELSDAGNTVESADWLKKFMTQEVMGEDGKKHQKKWSGTDEELDAIVTWVMSLKK
jgi:cytochrome c551/c552